MRILYQSSLCSDKTLKKIYSNSDVSPGIQVQKYNKLIAEGLSMNGQNVYVLTSLPVSRAVSKKYFIYERSEVIDNITYFYYPIINIPVLKDILILICSFIKTFLFLMIDKNSYVISDLLSLPNALGATLAARLFCRDTVGILTDLPEYVIGTNNSFFVKLYYLVIKLQNKYVFLTEEMNKKINVNNKEYIIIEGWCDSKRMDRNEINKKNYILYSGNLNKNNGIHNLVSAFLKIKSNYQLIIFGSGDYASELRELARGRSDITYYGFVENDVVLKYQEESRILVIPRPVNEDFVKYSFPSKLIEYMQSGTITITTRLPGIPNDYFEYIYFFDSADVTGLKAGLEKLIVLSGAELDERGHKAKEFVLNNKNNFVQANKILKLLRGELWKI